MSDPDEPSRPPREVSFPVDGRTLAGPVAAGSTSQRFPFQGSPLSRFPARASETMRLRQRLSITFVALALLGTAAWVYASWPQWVCRWALYRVAAAETAGEARSRIAWFESGPEEQRRLEKLVAEWGTGNERFDFHLAEYVSSPQCPEAVRKTFSLRFGWHARRLPRWAHYWSWRQEDPEREMASVLAYLDLIVDAEPRRTLTWREVLDLQAIFCLSGEPERARRLDPANWRARYRDWRKARGDETPRVERPSRPFPDWEGPVPALPAGAGLLEHDFRVSWAGDAAEGARKGAEAQRKEARRKKGGLLIASSKSLCGPAPLGLCEHYVGRDSIAPGTLETCPTTEC